MKEFKVIQIIEQDGKVEGVIFDRCDPEYEKLVFAFMGVEIINAQETSDKYLREHTHFEAGCQPIIIDNYNSKPDIDFDHTEECIARSINDDKS